ncbi:MAG: PepSY domain-containing protein [Methylococcaceae bacterium]
MRTIKIVFLLVLCLTSSVYAVGNVISLDQATSKVIQQNNGKVLGARTETMEGRVMHVIKILTRDGRIQHIKVDAETGQVSK